MVRAGRGTGATATRRARAGRCDRRGTHGAGARAACGEVVAYDITPQMLAETARNAAERGLTNVVIRQGAAEQLPFGCQLRDRQRAPGAASFRRRGARGARDGTGTKPGGRVIIVDSRAPEDPILDREFNHIEKLRDPSHVRNYRPSEWRTMVTRPGCGLLRRAGLLHRKWPAHGFRGMDQAGEYTSASDRRTDPSVPQRVARIDRGLTNRA